MYKPPVDRINSTAEPAYKRQDPGIGGGREAMKRYPPPEGSVILDVGFGGCEIAKVAIERKCKVFGVDIAEASWGRALTEGLIQKGFSPIILDVSHQPFPLPDNIVDWVYCTSTVEHLSNPYFAFSEVKRVLKDRGKFVIQFPMPESCLGYGKGKHAQVYPGFLLRDSFERFMLQLYFRKIERAENGDAAWYLFENCKNGPIVDLFKIVAGNFDESTLYDWMVNKDGNKKR